MTPDEYERHVAAVLRDEGWDARVTPSRHDYGLDVVAERQGERLGVQAKMYSRANRPVNAATVMLTYGAAAYAGCSRCMIATDGRVLRDAQAVAGKLGVEIRLIESTRQLAATSPTGVAEQAEPLEVPSDPSFGSIWREHIEPLAGGTLRRSNGQSNQIISVGARGVLRRTSNGKRQLIEIDVFRWAIERLLKGEVVLRDDINAQCIGRASSGVMLILSTVPLFEPTTRAGKRGLVLRDGSASG